jgi:hypothetical protein
MDSRQVATVLNRVLRKIDEGSVKQGAGWSFVVDEFCREFSNDPTFDVAEFVGLTTEGVIS